MQADEIKSGEITYTHKNYAGKVDILVLEDVTGEGYKYGRVFADVDTRRDLVTDDKGNPVLDKDGNEQYTETTTTKTRVENSTGKLVEFEVNRGLSTGQWVGFSAKAGNDQMITTMFQLTPVRDIPASAWRDGESVYHNRSEEHTSELQSP